MGKRYRVPVTIGEKIGKLTILREVESIKNQFDKNVRVIECKCDCGNVVKRRLLSVKSLNTQSCGCLKKGVKPFYPK